MKLGLIFFVFAATIFYGVSQIGNRWLEGLLANCGLAFLLLSGAYFLNAPKTFLKRPDGNISAIGWVLFWPYFLLSWLSLKLFRAASGEASFNEIVPGLFLGCRLGSKDREAMQKLNIQSVLDLTAEFHEIAYLRTVPVFRCIPVLDHCAPGLEQLQAGVKFIQDQLPSGSLYVHCALGHSRSSTFVAGYLLASGIALRPENAVTFIQAKRPGASLNPDQSKILKRFDETRAKSR